MRVNSGLDLSLVAVRISESGNGYIKKIKNHITLDIFIYRPALALATRHVAICEDVCHVAKDL